MTHGKSTFIPGPLANHIFLSKVALALAMTRRGLRVPFEGDGSAMAAPG